MSLSVRPDYKEPATGAAPSVVQRDLLAYIKIIKNLAEDLPLFNEVIQVRISLYGIPNNIVKIILGDWLLKKENVLLNQLARLKRHTVTRTELEKIFPTLFQQLHNLIASIPDSSIDAAFQKQLKDIRILDHLDYTEKVSHDSPYKNLSFKQRITNQLRLGFITRQATAAEQTLLGKDVKEIQSPKKFVQHNRGGYD